jgi:hypothetical protein
MRKKVEIHCDYILVVKYGDPYSNEEQRTAFGPFPSREDAESFRQQYYYNQLVIVEITPINAVFPDSVTASDIDFTPDQSDKVVSIHKNKIDIIFTPEDETH